MSRNVIGSVRDRGNPTADASGMYNLLAESRRLIDRVIDEYRTDPEEPDDIVRTSPGDGWEDEIIHCMRSARDQVMFVVSSHFPLCTPSHHESTRSVVADLLATGKQVRLTCSPDFLKSGDPAAALSISESPIEARVVDADFSSMIIVDNRIAAIWGVGSDLDSPGFVIRDPGLLRVLSQFAGSLWEFGTVPRHRSNDSVVRLDDTALAVLRALGNGLKDEVAARGLSVSLRTYRRYVADLMVRLGVTSRFQFGARAVELGLLEFAGDV